MKFTFIYQDSASPFPESKKKIKPGKNPNRRIDEIFFSFKKLT